MVTGEHVDAVMMIAGGGLALPYTVTGVRYLTADSDRRQVMRRGWLIRATWRATAARVGLVQTDHAAKVGADIPLAGELRRGSDKPRVLVPKIKVFAESWGLLVEVETVGRLGIGEFQAAADYLANSWRVPHVRVEQDTPASCAFVPCCATH